MQLEERRKERRRINSNALRWRREVGREGGKERAGGAREGGREGGGDDSRRALG